MTEFGDFQTPPGLAARACGLLRELGVEAASILEPTCGRGAFLFAAADRWASTSIVTGFDINPAHVARARISAEVRSDASRIRIEQADFFQTDWSTLIAGLPEPVVVIGNPPWITNSQVSILGGSNVPEKSNFQGHNGLDAITGKGNFDISEWMLIKLAEALTGRNAVLAMLVKTIVARKILYHCWTHEYCIVDAKIFRVDAGIHFNAAVDASLIVLRFGSSQKPAQASVFGHLSAAAHPVSTIALASKTIVADLDAYEQTKHLGGGSPLRWRTGIKHDCSKVMELERRGERFRNGLGETVDLETEYLFPMLKSSEVANAKKNGRGTRWMIVPQCRVGESTDVIADRAPKTWEYLQEHRRLLEKRGSIIYRRRPDFSIFGVGDYSFAPWKVAISGMHKMLRFVKVGPYEGKPVVFDDTTNFLPCPSETSATLLLSMLESKEAQTFYRAFVFWDAKRPITVEFLSRMNLHALAADLDILPEFEKAFGAPSDMARKRKHSRRRPGQEPTFW